MTAYILGQTCVNSTNSLLSALFMQIQNAGLRINFGLSRGTGSVLFAFTAYFLGNAVEKHSPEILFPLQAGLTFLALLFIIIIPRPEKISGEHPDKVHEASTRSMVTMLKENPTFIMLMLAMVATFTGHSYFGFFINIIRNAGGNTADLGLALFIYALVEILPMLLSVKLLVRFGPKDLLVVSVAAFFAKAFLIKIASSVGFIYAVSVTNIFSTGLFFFASVYFVNEIVRPNERTRGQALIGLCSFGGLGTVIGASISGMLLDRFGIDDMMLFCTVCSFAGFLLMLATSFLHKKHFEKQGS